MLFVGGREVVAAPHLRRPIRRLQHLHGAAHLAHHRRWAGSSTSSSAAPPPWSASTSIMTEKPEIADAEVSTQPGAPSSRGSRRLPDRRKDLPTRDPRRHRVPQSHFRYGNDAEVGRRAATARQGRRSGTENVNLRVPAGTSLAIVGPTGSGKSTLVSLIPRIYDADPGTVLIDGRADPRVSARDICAATSASFRRRHFSSATPSAKT